MPNLDSQLYCSCLFAMWHNSIHCRHARQVPPKDALHHEIGCRQVPLETKFQYSSGSRSMDFAVWGRYWALTLNVVIFSPRRQGLLTQLTASASGRRCIVDQCVSSAAHMMISRRSNFQVGVSCRSRKSCRFFISYRFYRNKSYS